MNMKTKPWKSYVFWILLAEGVGLLSGLLTRNSMEFYGQSVAKPPLSPPGILFPIVWTVLYALMGIGAARVAQTPKSEERSNALLLFLLQLVFNFLWSTIFFTYQAFGAALIWLLALWVLIILMILAFRKVDPLAAKLQIPYLAWVTFAAYLNAGVWLLNR